MIRAHLFSSLLPHSLLFLPFKKSFFPIRRNSNEFYHQNAVTFEAKLSWSDVGNVWISLYSFHFSFFHDCLSNRMFFFVYRTCFGRCPHKIGASWMWHTKQTKKEKNELQKALRTDSLSENGFKEHILTTYVNVYHTI